MTYAHDGHEGHEEHEEHEGQVDQGIRETRRAGRERDSQSEGGRPYRVRVRSPLSPAADDLMTAVIGCAVAVHSELGPGFIESIYHKAMRLELKARGLAFETERRVFVNYRGVALGGQRVDLIVGNLIVVELKSVLRLDGIHRRQLLSYLRTTGLRGGLLINFRTELIKFGIVRVVL